MTAATATTPTAAAIATTTAQHETADHLALHCAALRTELLTLQQTFPTRADVQPRIIELERELAAAETRLAELREAEARTRPAEQPAGPTFKTLPEFLEHVKNLRRMTDQLQTAGANIEHMHAALEAQEAALKDLAAVEVAALLERIKAGHEDLSDEQRRGFREQKRSVAGLLRDMPVDLDELPALKRTVVDQGAELDRQWAHSRAEGRRLVREAIEADARNALASIDDPRATVAELIEHFETARDLAAAHDAFFNSPSGREVLGYENAQRPDGTMVPGMLRWGTAGRLAEDLQLEAYHARLQALAPSLSLEPDASAVDRTLESFQMHFGALAYTQEERRLERVCHVTPTGRHVLRHFQANPNAYGPMHRVELERRVAEIEAATRALETLRSTPF